MMASDWVMWVSIWPIAFSRALCRVTKNLFQNPEQLRAQEGLAQERPVALHQLRHRGPVERAHEDYRNVPVRRVGGQGGQQAGPVQDRHHRVGDDHVRTRLGEAGQRLPPVRGGDHLVAGVGQGPVTAIGSGRTYEWEGRAGAYPCTWAGSLRTVGNLHQQVPAWPSRSLRHVCPPALPAWTTS